MEFIASFLVGFVAGFGASWFVKERLLDGYWVARQKVEELVERVRNR